MSEDFISAGTFFILSFVFHFFQKICERDYVKAKEDFQLLIKNKQHSEWEYNIKKYQMDINKTRKWCAIAFKYLCFVIAILIFINLTLK